MLLRIIQDVRRFIQECLDAGRKKEEKKKVMAVVVVVVMMMMMATTTTTTTTRVAMKQMMMMPMMKKKKNEEEEEKKKMLMMIPRGHQNTDKRTHAANLSIPSGSQMNEVEMTGIPCHVPCLEHTAQGSGDDRHTVPRSVPGAYRPGKWR